MRKIILFSLLVFSSNTTFAEPAYKPQTAGKKMIPPICQATIYGNDKMQYVDAKGTRLELITAPTVCKQFVVHFKYQGNLPSTVMGHNWILTEERHIQEVSFAAVKQGVAKGYLPSLEDSRVLAASSRLLGGSANDYKEDEITVDMEKMETGKNYAFWCSFPGHINMMRGTFKLQGDSPISAQDQGKTTADKQKG